jgi:hypothetical protein
METAMKTKNAQPRYQLHAFAPSHIEDRLSDATNILKAAAQGLLAFEYGLSEDERQGLFTAIYDVLHLMNEERSQRGKTA